MRNGEEAVYVLLDVIVQKLHWATLGKWEKDMLDTVSILKVRHDRLDYDYIREWCAQLEIMGTFVEVEA